MDAALRFGQVAFAAAFRRRASSTAAAKVERLASTASASSGRISGSRAPVTGSRSYLLDEKDDTGPVPESSTRLSPGSSSDRSNATAAEAAKPLFPSHGSRHPAFRRGREHGSDRYRDHGRGTLRGSPSQGFKLFREGRGPELWHELGGRPERLRAENSSA